ncbi:MAG: PCRF domain-containing protein [Candidatus Liptonbacteria bacterium]
MRKKPADWAGVFEVEKKEIRIKELTTEMSDPDFWQNRAAVDAKIKELGELQALTTRYVEISAGIEKLEKNFDNNLFFEIKRKFRQLELEQLFNGTYDKQSAVISVYPGAGGDDASDWSNMLFEMFDKYAARRGWKTSVLDDNPNRRTLEIRGDYAYGYLKKESGVHRLVRISPFSAQKLRHTSFALVEVVPDLPELDEAAITLPEKDLKFEFYRAGGPGGQNVNKVETAARAIHLPTGLSASSQVERSQAQNREKAVRLLKSKLIQLMEKNQVQELSALRTKAKPEWGSQIRSYVLNPYQLVKDHRTNRETSRVEEVLNGDLDIFIEAEIEAVDS